MTGGGATRLAAMRCLLLALALAMMLAPVYALNADAHRTLTVSSTAYCSSEPGGQITADGSRTYFGEVATPRPGLYGSLPLGTLIELISPRQITYRNRTRRLFRARDRIGYGSQLDFFFPSCAAMNAWGRRTVTFRVRSPRP